MRPFCLLGSQIVLYRYVLTYKDAKEQECSTYEIDMPNVEATKKFLLKEGAKDFVVKKLDVSELEWLEGLDVGKEESMKEAERIWKMGAQAYHNSLYVPGNEEYLLEIEYRLSLLELGI